ncbi:hypothetical protein ARMGADRAFT_1092469 [Armillaria gallica]|uniref:F-box domain-containing protein n=1 Tax=Armillaria gallica TaxID=47427 RepID=A0A2H3CE96_ARMGA|nr:hypothetical protein ARMGADRAFT_1092469 [Armillaria gallica]
MCAYTQYLHDSCLVLLDCQRLLSRVVVIAVGDPTIIVIIHIGPIPQDRTLTVAVHVGALWRVDDWRREEVVFSALIVPDDVLSLIFAEAIINDPRWTEELAGVCRHFYELARYLSVKRILIHDFHHSSHLPEATVRRFSGAGHQNDGLVARELHWCANFLRPEALWRVMVLLSNVDRLCLRCVWLDKPVDWFPMSALHGLDLVDCMLSFAVLGCLLQAVPNVVCLAIHGGETKFVPSTDEPAEEELSLHHLPQALLVLHLDMRQALNTDRGGQ